MKHSRAYGVFVVWTCVLILIASPRAQQRSKPVRTGFPQDWTQQHLLFSRDALMKNPRLMSIEPRIAHLAMQRWQGPRAQALNSGRTSFNSPKRDWSVALGLGRIAPNMFPAKYSLDPGAAPDCTNDYVVFGLNRVGSLTQANLVGFNNLYTGAGPNLCGATGPNVMFAYNITTVLPGGRIITSPALSLDGKEIAFVESSPSGNVFHVITWKAGDGVIGTPVVPGASAVVGVPGTMTSLPFATVVDTRSSPWVDYNSDTAYVGADDGNIYKISPVFLGGGTPALAGAPWPVAVSPNVRPSSPVLDKNLGLVMVGSQNGTYHSIDTTSGAVKALVVGVSGGTNPGILAPPIVDVSNGISFVVSSNDSTSGVLVEVDSATMTRLAKAQIGLASQSGTAVNLFQPAFSDGYFNDPTTGVARLCGTGAADITPWQYAFGFTFDIPSGKFLLNTTPVFSQQLLTSTTARCTGWTEFFNANAGPGGTDFFFFGLTADCTGPGTSGCVVSRTSDVSLTTVPITGGPSGIVIDNNSADPEASSIYLTGAQAPNNAYKFTQAGLN